MDATVKSGDTGSPAGCRSADCWLVCDSQVPWKSYPCTVAKSRLQKILRTSKPASMFAGLAGRNAVSWKCLRTWRPYASSWSRNSCSSLVKSALSCGRDVPPMRLLAGHSQSMSKPSNTPAATPGPPLPPSRIGRLPLMNRSMQDATNACRDCGVSAASEKYFDQVKPPIDISTLSPGCRCFNFRS